MKKFWQIEGILIMYLKCGKYWSLIISRPTPTKVPTIECVWSWYFGIGLTLKPPMKQSIQRFLSGGEMLHLRINLPNAFFCRLSFLCGQSLRQNWYKSGRVIRSEICKKCCDCIIWSLRPQDQKRLWLPQTSRPPYSAHFWTHTGVGDFWIFAQTTCWWGC